MDAYGEHAGMVAYLVTENGQEIYCGETGCVAFLGGDWDSERGYAHDWSGKTELARKFVHGGRKLIGAAWHGDRDAVKLENCGRGRAYPCYHDVRMNLGIRGGVNHWQA